MLMGICRLPRLSDYWSTTHPLICPGLPCVMSLVRFQQIFRFLHLNDTDKQVPFGQPGYDPLFKVRKYLDVVTPLLESEYNLHEQLSIDEAMIPFKGRLDFKQYMKDKPIKWGIKVFVLSDATNGYVYRLQIYAGKNNDLAVSSASEFGLCSRVVLELLAGLESTNPKVFKDNYYTSPRLFLELYNKGVNACGTARADRKYYPKQLAVNGSIVEAGYYDYRSSGPLLACFWKDRRVINFMSTMHVAKAGAVPATVSRRALDGTREDVMCPPCILVPCPECFMM